MLTPADKDVIREALQWMRDDRHLRLSYHYVEYAQKKAAIDTALAHLDEGEWEPVEADLFDTPDSEGSAVWVSGGNVLCIACDGDEVCITLPSNVRLCRRRTPLKQP